MKTEDMSDSSLAREMREVIERANTLSEELLRALNYE